eukprot:NODE_9944_length_323_cov_56.414179.p4 GENE.NODE_9944_length_323_cov_56.414179~~NODE_9944_length_323_cov_56.414179.p4  ORF type:complete len:52 (-),score=3.73 NODE_9944_length_323_cov_56.414179:112-267(-)
MYSAHGEGESVAMACAVAEWRGIFSGAATLQSGHTMPQLAQGRTEAINDRG